MGDPTDLDAASGLVRVVLAEREAATDPHRRLVALDRTTALTDTLAVALVELGELRARVAELEAASRRSLWHLAWMTRPGGRVGCFDAARRALTEALNGGEHPSGSDAERDGNAARLGRESGPEAATNSPRALGTPSKLTAERTHVDDTATPADPAHAEVER